MKTRLFGAMKAPLLLVCVTGLLSACVIRTSRSGNQETFVVIGFGIVRTGETERSAVLATDVQAIGATLSDRPGLKFGLGYSQSTVISVPDGASDVRVELAKQPWRPLVLDTQSAILSTNPLLMEKEK